ncbi:MAG: hypothetical protein ABW200_01130, partial [Hyphomicrobiaceae bacterium]
YFHLHDDLDVSDDEGLEFPDLEAAREYAGRCARSLMCATLAEERRITLHHRIDIENDHGDVLATVRFADALRIESDETLAAGRF